MVKCICKINLCLVHGIGASALCQLSLLFLPPLASKQKDIRTSVNNDDVAYVGCCRSLRYFISLIVQNIALIIVSRPYCKGSWVYRIRNTGQDIAKPLPLTVKTVLRPLSQPWPKSIFALLFNMLLKGNMCSYYWALTCSCKKVK